jgi:ribose 5-phosphate isomerase A
MPLTSLDVHEALDLAVDGADQVSLPELELLKGGGGALLREKLVASSSARLVIIVDQSKLTECLGGSRPVPVEVVRFGWRQTARRLEQLGCRPELRQWKGEAFVSDEGHFVLDCTFPPLTRASQTARAIKEITGVVDHGLFVDLAELVVVGSGSGIRCFERQPKPRAQG